jgi:hypothetical protein
MQRAPVPFLNTGLPCQRARAIQDSASALSNSLAQVRMPRSARLVTRLALTREVSQTHGRAPGAGAGHLRREFPMRRTYCAIQDSAFVRHTRSSGRARQRSAALTLGAGVTPAVIPTEVERLRIFFRSLRIAQTRRLCGRWP